LKRWTAALVLVSCLFIAFNGVGESLQITLLGDCTMGGSLFNRVAKREGLAYFFSGLEHVLTTDDLTLANCEGVFTNRKAMKAKALEILKTKRKGTYCVIKMDTNYVPEETEQRRVYSPFSSSTHSHSIAETVITLGFLSISLPSLAYS